jgi:hypothetical protein
MNYKRMFANAIARRVVYVVVAAAIGLALSMCSGEARANGSPFQTDGEAWDACITDAESWPQPPPAGTSNYYDGKCIQSGEMEDGRSRYY